MFHAADEDFCFVVTVVGCTFSHDTDTINVFAIQERTKKETRKQTRPRKKKKRGRKRKKRPRKVRKKKRKRRKRKKKT